MSGTTKNNCRPEGGICEQFGCPPNSDACLNSWAMNELLEIALNVDKGGKQWGQYYYK